MTKNNEIHDEPRFDLDFAKRKINSILDDLSRVEYLRGWNDCLDVCEKPGAEKENEDEDWDSRK